ncbi:MAG: 3-keto-disaccharide hydrolase [Bacteroidota bacterium]
MKKTSLLLILGVALISINCKDETKDKVEIVETENMNDQEDQEVTKLFNGENLDGWKAYNSDEITQWTVEDGAIAFSPAEGERSGSENLITEEEFTDFELSLEWKISEGGNSGIMWGVQEDEKFNEPYVTGPEIQILDNKRHPDAENGPIRQAGALYDMVPASKDVTKPVGEWNKVILRIDHETNLGSVTLNGEKITEFPVHGEEWDKMVEGSKFEDWEDFGKHRTGHIALQDHDDKVWFRNIQIRELK